MLGHPLTIIFSFNKVVVVVVVVVVVTVLPSVLSFFEYIPDQYREVFF